MLIRVALILSLVAQQALGFSCCGVQMLRPDIVRPDCQRACNTIGACEPSVQVLAALPCENETETCCNATLQQSAEFTEPEPPCTEEPGQCTPPLDEKKQSPHAQNVDFVAAVAHPALPPAWAAIQWQQPPSLQPLPRWFSHHQRQAWLVLWLN